MKRLVAITGIILFICVLISTVFSTANSVNTESSMQIVTSETAQEAYLVTTLDNVIVVYKKGEDTPFLKTDTRTDNLPNADKVYLEKGIEITGKENLRKTLEDYCS